MSDHLTVLVVDDDVLIAMTCADMVTELGYRAIEANSGTQALDVIAQEPRVDLLITDYSMPSMDGVQLVKAAREVVPDLKVIVATGYADLPPDSGLDVPRISKPYTLEDLEAAIRKTIGEALA
jgi:CheY-like chemotaxis protein